MSTPRVSVIVPVHNSERFLEQCLDSILAQTERDIEVICIDDGSTDSSGGILDRYAAEDNRVRVLHQKGSGAGAARNRGIDLARGTYLSFLDSDDFFEPEMLKASADRLDETGADVVVFETWVYDTSRDANRRAPWYLRWSNVPDKEPFCGKDLSDHLFLTFGNCVWNKVFRSQFVEKHGLRFQEISRWNDLYFSCTSLALASSIATVRQYLIHYRISTATSLQSTNDRDPLTFYEALRKILRLLEDTELYGEFERSYVNLVLDSVAYNIDTLHTPTAFAQLRNLVLNETEPLLHILSRPEGYLENAQQLEQYRNLCELDPVEYLLRRVQALKKSREDLYWLNDWRAWRMDVLDKENQSLSERLDASARRCDEIRASASYRVGHALLAPARAVRSALSRG